MAIVTPGDEPGGILLDYYIKLNSFDRPFHAIALPDSPFNTYQPLRSLAGESAYRQIFFKPELDAANNPILENGRPKLVPQDEVIKHALGTAWQRYRASLADDQNPTPDGAMRFFEAHKNEPDSRCAEALQYLRALHDLTDELKNQYLHPYTNQRYQVALCAKVRPLNISLEELRGLLQLATPAATRPQ
jgi:hypothetical protein